MSIGPAIALLTTLPRTAPALEPFHALYRRLNLPQVVVAPDADALAASLAELLPAEPLEWTPEQQRHRALHPLRQRSRRGQWVAHVVGDDAVPLYAAALERVGRDPVLSTRFAAAVLDSAPSRGTLQRDGLQQALVDALIPVPHQFLYSMADPRVDHRDVQAFMKLVRRERGVAICGHRFENSGHLEHLATNEKVYRTDFGKFLSGVTCCS